MTSCSELVPSRYVQRATIIDDRLRDLADSIERRGSLTELLEVEGWAPELWDALDRLHERRLSLARRLRRWSSQGPGPAEGEEEATLRSLIEQISWCEREETELFLRAFWLDIGTVD